MTRKRRSFTPEYKAEVVGLVRDGGKAISAFQALLESLRIIVIDEQPVPDITGHAVPNARRQGRLVFQGCLPFKTIAFIPAAERGARSMDFHC